MGLIIMITLITTMIFIMIAVIIAITLTSLIHEHAAIGSRGLG